jgi:hypothetical protein
MNTLSRIGYEIANPGELEPLAHLATQEGLKADCAEGSYFLLPDESGAQLYFQANNNRELIGFTPHFDGRSRRTIGVTEMIQRPFSEMAGAIYGWSNPPEPGNVDAGDYPLVFEVPDYCLLKPIAVPSIQTFQLTAFADDEFAIFGSEEELKNAQDTQIKFGPEAFIPAGLFGPDGEPTESPKSSAIFSGRIVRWEPLVNSRTNLSFHWLLVQTHGGDVDVVVNSSLIKQEPVVGQIVFGQFWLSGRLVSP